MISEVRPRCSGLERVVLIGGSELERAAVARRGSRAKDATLSHHNIVNNGFSSASSAGTPRRTGSACRCRDSDGYLNITGRIKDMVIRGGENIYPREVEEFLYTHPDVVDAQVVGVPDHTYGEELCAWVRLREGAEATGEDLRSFCRGKLAHYKVPRYVRIVEEFPMTVTGKVQKFKMREAAIESLGLGAAAGIETA